MPPDLESLARAHFDSPLTKAEIELVQRSPKGEFAVCGPNMDDQHPNNDPSKAGDWPEARHIRAALIRWLCADEEAKQFMDSRGLQIYGAKITDALDLSYLAVPFPLVLSKSHLNGVMKLQAVKIPMLSLEGTWVHTIKADSAEITGGVFLRNGFHTGHEVRLHRARIGGGLDCSKGAFRNPAQEGIAGSGRALSADGIVVGGGVSLVELYAEGEVRLSRAQIQGDLDCSRGTFKNPPQKRAQGNDTALIEGTGTALNADGIDVNGGLFLRDCHAEGQVRLARSRTRMDLDCSRATLTGELNTQGAEIGGGLFWTGLVEPGRTGLDLINASVGSLADDVKSWPAVGNLKIDGFVYGRLLGPKDAKSRLAWLALQKQFTPQPYRQLANVLRNEGNETGAQKVLFEMERRRRTEENPPLFAKFLLHGHLERALQLAQRALVRPRNFLFKYTVGYGYYPGLALLWLLALVALGFALYRGGYYAGSFAPTDKDAYVCFTVEHRLPDHYERFHATIYSLENSFPLVKLGQVDRWQPDPSPKYLATHEEKWAFLVWHFLISPSFLRWFRWAQILSGWFLATMGIAAVTGIVRKG